MPEYTNEFKADVFNAYKGAQFIELFNAIEKGTEDNVRILLSDGIDDHSLYVPKFNKVGRGMKNVICKTKQTIYNKRVEVYSSFMNQYIKNYDRGNRR